MDKHLTDALREHKMDQKMWRQLVAYRAQGNVMAHSSPISSEAKQQFLSCASTEVPLGNGVIEISPLLNFLVTWSPPVE